MSSTITQRLVAAAQSSPDHHLLPSMARKGEAAMPSPKRMRSGARFPFADVTACAAFALIVCALLAALLHGRPADVVEEVAVAVAAPSMDIGMRTWKDVDPMRMRSLQQQLHQKEKEVHTLETTLKLQVATYARIQTNVHAQEGLIATLQRQLQAERAEKLRAVYSLGVMSQNMDSCLKLADEAEGHLHSCREEIRTHGRHQE